MDTQNSITRLNDGPGNRQVHAAEDHIFAPQPRARRDMTHIQGWGADLDRKDRPAVPMERTPPRLENAPIAAPSQQPERVEIFVSPERPGITPLFGTSSPPRGISGMLRRLAYKLTENDIRHWMLLLVADRVNVVEGVADDLMQGRVPNVLGEMGIKAEWQHNRAGLVQKAAVATAIVGIGYYLLNRREAER
ncbi:MAG: hypothetical protein ABWY27_00980 [Telluria sp.]